MNDYLGDCPCVVCGSSDTYMMGFDGDNGIEDWDCYNCGCRYQEQQVVIPAISEYLKEFWANKQHLTGKAKLEAKKYIGPVQKAYEELRNRGEWYE